MFHLPKMFLIFTWPCFKVEAPPKMCFCMNWETWWGAKPWQKARHDRDLLKITWFDLWHFAKQFLLNLHFQLPGRRGVGPTGWQIQAKLQVDLSVIKIMRKKGQRMSKTVITLDLPLVGPDPTQKVLSKVSLEFLWHWKVFDWYLETKLGRQNYN